MSIPFHYKIDSNTKIRDLDRWGFLGQDPIELFFQVRKSDDYSPIELVTIIQFLISNIKGNKSFAIKTNLSEDALSTIHKDYFHYHHLLAIILYNRDCTIRSEKGHIVLTTDLHARFIAKLKVQEDLYSIEFDHPQPALLDSSKKDLNELRRVLFPLRTTAARANGVAFFVPCFDNLKKEGLDKSYYFYGQNTFKESTDIAIWLKRLLRFNNLRFQLPNAVNDLAVVIKELMQNTHDWARTTYDNSAFILPNLRTCYINLVLEGRIPKELFGAYDPIQEYLKNVISADQEFLLENEQTPIFVEQKQLGVCEISVLDSGPGMASRLLEKPLREISTDEEIAAVIHCFHKHITSETASKKQIRGRGLSKILSLIGNKGLIRVRTGRVLLLRNFHKENLTNDEIEQGNLRFQTQDNLAPVEGTSISILYPFVYSVA